MSSGGDALKLMLETHFSGSVEICEGDSSPGPPPGLADLETKGWAGYAP
jgi:hypothetical protein